MERLRKVHPDYSKEELLNGLGLKRLCCRSNMITYVDYITLQLEYDRVNEQKEFNMDSSKFITEVTPGNTSQQKRTILAR